MYCKALIISKCSILILSQEKFKHLTLQRIKKNLIFLSHKKMNDKINKETKQIIQPNNKDF